MYKKVLFSSLISLLVLLPACNKCNGLRSKCDAPPDKDHTVSMLADAVSDDQTILFSDDLPA